LLPEPHGEELFVAGKDVRSNEMFINLTQHG